MAMNFTQRLTIQPHELCDQSLKPTVLVADDDATLLALITDALHHMGYRVLTGANGMDVECIVRTSHASLVLILLDYRMPHINGVDISRQLRANPYTADIPLVLMSARPPEDMSLFRGFLAKPFTLQALRDCVHQHQRSRRMTA